MILHINLHEDSRYNIVRIFFFVNFSKKKKKKYLVLFVVLSTDNHIEDHVFSTVYVNLIISNDNYYLGFMF